MKPKITKPVKTPYFSCRLGPLPRGCRYCVQGQKLVLFVTGLCPRHCYYCPLSDQKYQKDVTYADEWPTDKIKDIIQEAGLIQAQGAGLTGGDPLARLERTLRYIKALKKKFGRKFHLHLYTSFDLVTPDTLKNLYQAGLDEIRFHPDLDNPQLWPKILLARNYLWAVGVEIPVIPGKKKQTLRLINYFQDKIDFLNLNELEIADTRHNQLLHLGYAPLSPYSYAVKGSAFLARQLLHHLQKTGIPVHYCPAKLKDAVQLAARLKRRAKNTRQPFDQLTSEGLLLRGALYLPELKPGFSYHQILAEIKNKKYFVKKLNNLKKILLRELHLFPPLLKVDEQKLRLLTSRKIILKNKNYFRQKGLIPALVREYPTYDQLEMEVEFL